MKKILFFIIAFFTLLFGGAVSANADTTTEALQNLLKKDAVFEIYGNNQTAPMSVTEAGSENINTVNNSMNFSATDLTLPGKNGFDVNITRSHDSMAADRTGENYVNLTEILYANILYDSYGDVRPRQTRTQNIVAKYYLDNDVSKPYYILFKSVTEMKIFEETPGVIQVGDLSDEKKCYTTEDISTKLNYTNNYDMDFYQADASFPFPYFYRIHDITTSNNTYTLYRDSSESPYKIKCIFKTDYYLDADTGWNTVNLNAGWYIKVPMLYLNEALGKDTNIDAYVYRYKFYDPDTGTEARYTLELSKDKTTNLYTVPYGYIQGVNINGHHAETNMYKIITNLNPRLPEDERPECCIERYDGVRFYFSPKGTILRKEDRFGNAIKYTFTSDSSISRLTAMEDSYGRQITFEKDAQDTYIKVDGETMLSYYYEKINDESIDPQSKLDDDDKLVLTVQKGEAGAAGSTIEYNMRSRQCMWDVNSAQKVYKGMAIVYHCVIESIELSTGGKIHFEYGIEGTTYTYSDGNPEGASLIKKLVETTTLNRNSVTKTTDKTYNEYHQPTSISENDRYTKITYNDYGLPIEQKQKQSDGVYVGTKNTYSEDGKKVIKTESFKQTGDTYEYFETTDFEYNQYGEVTKTTAHNEPSASVVTDIAYNYAPEEEGILYTKTTTVTDLCIHP